MEQVLEKGTNFIWENARLLERAIFEYYFMDGSPDRIRAILRTYQNEDGGFGHALEPDLRAPDSHPVFVEFALRVLYECRLRDAEIAQAACDFMARHSDLNQGIPTVFASSQAYPRAPHMNGPGVLQPSMDRLTGLVGLVNWHGISHPWLPEAIEACLQDLATTRYSDAHTIRTSFCLIESISRDRPVDELFDKLASDLLTADFFCLDAPIKTYCLTPLAYAPLPDSFCRRIFSDSQIESHLDDMLSHQETDGGWSIRWEPPGGMAKREWRAQQTVSALVTLRAYGRI